MKTIFVVTDFSEATRNAVKYVLNWIQDVKLKCQVVLLNTYRIPSAPPEQLIRLNDELRQDSVRNLKTELQAAKNISDGEANLQIETVSHMGTLENVIDHLTAGKQILCLAVGNKENLDLNSFKKIHCPLLVIPAQAVYNRIENVAFIQEQDRPIDLDVLPPWKTMIGKPKLHMESDLSLEGLRHLTERNRIDLLVFKERPSSLTTAMKSLVGEFCLKLSTPLLFMGTAG